MPKHRKGSRGVEAKDIGNFQYERQSDSPGVARRPAAAAATRRDVNPAVLKRAYMLHNFQFVLRPDVYEMKATPGLPQGKRRLNEMLLSSDTAPPWDAVTAVVVRGTMEQFQCPICLEPPTAARVADCGHVFCLPCMSQYLSRLKQENKQRTCPVCHNFVTLGMLRPCIFRPIEPPCLGQRVGFTLLERRGGCCVLLRKDDPRWHDAAPMEDELPLPLLHEPSATFSRYILATEESECARRRLDCTAIMDALQQLNAQPRPLTQFDDGVLRFAEEALEMVLQEANAQSPQSSVRNSPPIAPKRPNVDGASTYYLYGESEGQPYYMHPISFKMLRDDADTRGVPLPNTVYAPVEEIVTFTQDESSRKHYKALAHVPLHGTIKFCLLDLSDLVLPSTLKTFAPSLARMREARTWRERGEESSGEDTSWQEYLRRYRAISPHCTEDSGVSPEPVPSEYSGISDLLISSVVTAWSEPGGLSGDSSLETRQRATKRHDTPIPSCWTAENSRRLFATPPMRPAMPTWGGHVFNPHKPSSAGLHPAQRPGC
ncbi:hypothetical protein TCDM_07475 [Trypanosoma cruzi Dm28c]|uniref:RING-type domain-containing protein n=2 Tax=Trypanosoma cruzi TaxID=5693 RepID=V5DAD1_TRYCR|nr:hypothetical protein TCDM_07475 [Trypanosoma cruzi Dm28c]PBJ76889.1 hypothetical protein BCY84_07685 [Trypanosoma cruzi cruzi]PBJ80168.1 hypothetical protein BCY84_01861 [Trypanosoma cruzi cruzi]PWU89494.1 hypothetical protein C4B63_59g134 [Trypanosoma cruzi]